MRRDPGKEGSRWHAEQPPPPGSTGGLPATGSTWPPLRRASSAPPPAGAASAADASGGLARSTRIGTHRSPSGRGSALAVLRLRRVGDAVALVRRLDTVDDLPRGGGVPDRRLGPREETDTPTKAPVARPRPNPRGCPRRTPWPSWRTRSGRLWTPEGSDALAYLIGRGLTDATIRAARLGVVPSLALPGRPRGIVIPWFDGDRLTLVKVRQPEGREPKYREVFRDRARLTGIYPGRRRHPARPPAGHRGRGV